MEKSLTGGSCKFEEWFSFDQLGKCLEQCGVHIWYSKEDMAHIRIEYSYHDIATIEEIFLACCVLNNVIAEDMETQENQVLVGLGRPLVRDLILKLLPGNDNTELHSVAMSSSVCRTDAKGITDVLVLRSTYISVDVAMKDESIIRHV